MRLSVVLACVLLLLLRPTISRQQSAQRKMEAPAFWTGNDLWKNCNEYKKTANITIDGTICSIYILGASQALLLASFCRETLILARKNCYVIEISRI
jgi:hypothetical protein